MHLFKIVSQYLFKYILLRPVFYTKYSYHKFFTLGKYLKVVITVWKTLSKGTNFNGWKLYLFEISIKNLTILITSNLTITIIVMKWKYMSQALKTKLFLTTKMWNQVTPYKAYYVNSTFLSYVRVWSIYHYHKIFPLLVFWDLFI